MIHPRPSAGNSFVVPALPPGSESVPWRQHSLPSWLHSIIEDEGRLTLTDYEAARLLGVSRGSLRLAIANGEIPAVRLGRRLLVPVLPLLRLIGVDQQLDDRMADE